MLNVFLNITIFVSKLIIIIVASHFFVNFEDDVDDNIADNDEDLEDDDVERIHSYLFVKIVTVVESRYY
jgi:hypothetical protein